MTREEGTAYVLEQGKGEMRDQVLHSREDVLAWLCGGHTLRQQAGEEG